MTAQEQIPVRVYTAGEFERLLDAPEYRDRRLELIDGEIVEKVVTIEHGMIVLLIGYHIVAYLRANPIGRAGTEIHHRVARDPHNLRLPDLSVIVNEPEMRIDQTAPRLPDLAVEVKSPANTLAELYEKARYYLTHGTRVVWLVIPAKRLVIALTPTTEDILDVTDTLTGGEVLPGFALPVAEIFKDMQSPVTDNSRSGSEEG